ncbi:MAG: cysteine--tRNA ligase [Phycisphaerae bacterium]|nr:cysteine--tRNA ligase [Phycisphaerae bacterium]
MGLRIYNTLSRRKEAFEPLVPGEVSIYLCGPTVYKESHIGHLVGPIIFDAFKRYLEKCKGFKVKLVVNITDVEDKLISQAKVEGVAIDDLAERITQMYFDSLRELGAFECVDEFPRATGNIAEIIKIVQGLVDKGLAYVVDSDVYFEVAKFDGYGKLSGRKLEDQLAGTRQLQGKAKSPGDFALWKESKEDEPGWDSPWGRGRPGWHIECSAMSMKYLGQTIDIHGGGRDLIFPHHENEIAQSEAYTGKPFVRYWMHNGLTRISTKAAGGAWQKMSKSVGNIMPISEALSEYDGETVRFFVLNTHYRRPIPYSNEGLANAAKALGLFRALFSVVEHMTSKDPYNLAKPAEKPPPELSDFGKKCLEHKQRFLEHLDDDFNTAGAIGVLFDLVRKTRNLAAQSVVTDQGLLWATSLIIYLGKLLGLFQSRPVAAKTIDQVDGKLIEQLIEQRNAARKQKDFATADSIRHNLSHMGITLEDLPGGKTIWHEKQQSMEGEDA